MTPIFVYGSLMAGEQNDGLLAAFPRKPAQVLGNLFMMPAGYPALVPSKEASPIHGEYIELPDFSMLTVLDHFERVHDGLYLRQEVEALIRGNPHPAWAYVLDAKTVRKRQLRRLDVDDWRKLRSY